MWWTMMKSATMTSWLMLAPSPNYCVCIEVDLPRAILQRPTLEHKCEYVFEADAPYPYFPTVEECRSGSYVPLDDPRHNTRFLR